MAVCDNEETQLRMNAEVMKDYERYWSWSWWCLWWIAICDGFAGGGVVMMTQLCSLIWVMVPDVYKWSSRCTEQQCTWWCGLSDTERENSWVDANTKKVTMNIVCSYSFMNYNEISIITIVKPGGRVDLHDLGSKRAEWSGVRELPWNKAEELSQWNSKVPSIVFVYF